jgi:hypothetical protein
MIPKAISHMRSEQPATELQRPAQPGTLIAKEQRRKEPLLQLL